MYKINLPALGVGILLLIVGTSMQGQVPQKRCMNTGGGTCGDEQNECPEGCTKCTGGSTNVAGCTGAAGPCYTHIDPQGCGLKEQAECDSNQNCVNWTTLSTDCPQKECNP